jgi:hypothetical protein
MKRWLETQGYAMVYRLAARDGRVGRWLHDRWVDFWYRHYCPHPIKDDCRARACVAAGDCGCSNLVRYSVPNGEQR